MSGPTWRSRRKIGRQGSNCILSPRYFLVIFPDPRRSVKLGGPHRRHTNCSSRCIGFRYRITYRRAGKQSVHPSGIAGTSGWFVAKNSILIVEFTGGAPELREWESSKRSSRPRSLGFAHSHDGFFLYLRRPAPRCRNGSRRRRVSVGTVVFAGMLGVTVLGVFYMRRSTSSSVLACGPKYLPMGA